MSLGCIFFSIPHIFELEAENRRLKAAVAELTLDKQILKKTLARNGEPHGPAITLKQVYRIYREQGLAARDKKRKQVARANRRPRTAPVKANEQWSMDSWATAFRTTANSERST